MGPMVTWLASAVAPPEDKVQPGWLGFFVVLGLGIVTFLLWRSMNKQLKRVNFDDRPTDDEDHEAGKGDVVGTAGDPESANGVDENQDKPPGSTTRRDT
jgi:hypothetical protein